MVKRRKDIRFHKVPIVNSLQLSTTYLTKIKNKAFNKIRKVKGEDCMGRRVHP
jgi:hypothetical protein